MFKIFLLTVSSFLLFGCGASGPIFALKAPVPGKARLVIYRGEVGSNILDAKITIDNKSVALLAQNGFITVDVSPGKHKILVSFENKSGFARSTETIKTLTVRANQTKYLKYHSNPIFETQMIYYFYGTLNIIDSKNALPTVSKYREGVYIKN